MWYNHGGDEDDMQYVIKGVEEVIWPPPFFRTYNKRIISINISLNKDLIRESCLLYKQTIIARGVIRKMEN